MSLPALTTLAAVKTYAGVTGTATDDVLNALITGVSGFIRAWLNRDITTNSYDIRRSGRGTFAMQLPQYPITAVAAVEIDSLSIPAAASWGKTGFSFDTEQIVLSGHCFTRGNSNVRIQFTAGYAMVPDEIAQACNELVTLRFRTRDKLEISSKSLAGETVSFTQKDMPASVATVLRNYRLVAPL